MADGMKVVTLGADLSDAQKETMMKYFNVSSDEVEILTITNQDERDHLSAYVPLEQIGTRTVSCAYVKPTTSGGIKVRTANLNWVTGNMIATTLSTSGVKNCEVIAACPFEVSGTGALTGIQMAYETATGETLDETKKELATEEMVVTGNLADEVGQNDATTVINQAKMNVIQNGVQNADEIYNIVYNTAQQNSVTLDSEQMQTIVDLLTQIAQQNYNYDDVKETLERVDENVTGESTGESSDSTSDADSILNDVDESILGDDVIASSTEDPTLEEETGYTVDESSSEASGTSGEETSGEDMEEFEVYDTESGTDENGEDIPELSEQAQSQYEKAQDFCAGEYEGDLDALWNVMGAETYPSVDLEYETGVKLSEKVEAAYFKILSEGTGSYMPTGDEEYMSVELNMMQQTLKEIFNIDQVETYSDSEEEETEEDILAALSQEEKELLYKDTMKFFEQLYGESTETEAYAEESGESYEESYDTESYEAIPEGTEETYEG
jgi:uncharacterized protein YpuA (DUF1002 family)